ncbi:hypothetical protein K1719_032724 [Acacia pycnantha]|nr:hypothetical protein K1719_032724 [Acacia pycnantha]
MLAMLCLTSGCFLASTSFLPRSFSLYAISLASGLFLLDKPAAAVPVFATRLILGGPLSILAFLLSDNFLFIKKVQASIYCWGCDLNCYSGIINTFIFYKHPLIF